MTRHGLVIVLIAPAFGLAAAAAARAQDAANDRRVLIISCDGLRPDAIDSADAPILKQLIVAGAYAPTAQNEIPPITLPNHASMVTGLGVARHGVLVNTDAPGRIGAETIFDVAHAEGLAVGCFYNKTKIGYLCDESVTTVRRQAGGIENLTDEIIAALTAHDLRLIFVHFGEPDGTGHREGWMSPAYLEIVGRVDAQIGRILVELDALGLRERTVVIVTADHGGHDQTHFLDIPVDRTIPWIIQGPGIAVGRTLCDPVRVTDTAATALAVLRLPTNTALDGRVVTEAFDGETTSGAPCSAPPISTALPCSTLPAAALLLMAAAMHVRRGHGLVRSGVSWVIRRRWRPTKR